MRAKIIEKSQQGTLFELNLATFAFMHGGGDKLEIQQSNVYGVTKSIIMSARDVIRLGVDLDLMQLEKDLDSLLERNSTIEISEDELPF